MLNNLAKNYPKGKRIPVGVNIGKAKTTAPDHAVEIICPVSAALRIRGLLHHQYQQSQHCGFA